MSFDAPRRRLPTFLKIVMVAAGAMGALGTVTTLGFIVATGFVPGPYTVNGQRASFGDFFAFAVPVLVGYLLISAGMMVLAWGLKRERLWARPLLLGLAGATVVVPLTMAIAMRMMLGVGLIRVLAPFVILVVLWWQLYFDDDIVAYYAALREEELTRAG